jgi:ribosome-binding protein aMBF1 (putative translation factor)
MTTWDAYEKRVQEADPDGALSFDEAENYVSLIYPMVVRREELGLSVDDLVERAGLSPTTIRRVEGAGYNPTFKTLIKMAGALGMKLTVEEE